MQRSSRSSRSLLLEPLSQSAAFEAPRALAPGTGIPPGSHRPSRFSHDRLAFRHVGSRVLPLTLWTRCTSELPLRRSFLQCRFRRGDFRGQEPEAPPYPVSGHAYQFSSVSKMQLPASPCGPLMVKLFAARDLLGTPRRIVPGQSCRHGLSSPRWPRLSGPLGPEPPGVDFHHFDHHGLSPWGRGVSASPCPQREAWAPSDRTQGLISRFPRGVRPASLRRSGRATLMASGSTSRTRPRMDSPEPLAWLVARFARCGPPV